jgi:chromosome segregation ATPase
MQRSGEMAFTTILELILIIAISGMIAISVYVLYLVDKLLSRIETLEQKLVSFQSARMKIEDLESLKRNAASSSSQIAAMNEVLESTGKDIDSINSKISSLGKGLEATVERTKILERSVTETNASAVSIRKDIATLTRKLDQLERETELLETKQQISSEF